MASEITLVVEPRQETGSRPAKRLRREGRIPAVVYGRGHTATSVTIVRRDLRTALNTDAGVNALLDLRVGGERLLAIVRELQRDAVRNEVSHVDFILVSRDEAVTVDVPIVLHGEAEAVHQEGGTIEQQLYNLTISAKPGDIPNEIGVDISGLSIGDAVRVGDLVLPAGTTTEVEDDDIVLIAHVSQAAQESEALDVEAAETAALEELAAAGIGEGDELPPAEEPEES